jgi:thymidine phosphorylase
VVDLGGGRRVASDKIDARVGLSDLRPCGTHVVAGEPLMRVHAASQEAARVASARVTAAITFASRRPQAGPVVIDRIPAG